MLPSGSRSAPDSALPLRYCLIETVAQHKRFRPRAGHTPSSGGIKYPVIKREEDVTWTATR